MDTQKTCSFKKTAHCSGHGLTDDLYGAKKHGIDDGGHIPADATTSGTMMRAAGSGFYDIDHIGRFADTGNIAAI